MGPLNSSWLNGRLVTYPGTVRGKEFYVDSVNGATTNSGSSWDHPLTTLDAAIAKCTANKGDVIHLAPLHAEAEAVALADIATMDVAGVTVIGHGTGSNIPTFSFTADDATFTISAANCRLSGVKIVSGVADLAVGLTLGALADGAVIDNCIFQDGAVDEEIVISISVTADCDNIRIIDNVFSTVAAGGCQDAILLAGGSDNSIISGNVIYGTYSGAAMTASAAASINLTIIDNVFGNIDTPAVALNAGTTGILANNQHAATQATIGSVLTGTDATWCFNNYSSGVVGSSGLLQPNVDGD